MRPIALLFLGVAVGWAASGVDWSRDAVGETPLGVGQVPAHSDTTKQSFGNAVRSTLDDVSIWAIVEQRGGAPILNVFAVNESGLSLEFGESGYFLDCSISVTTDSREVVPYTEIGQQIFAGKEPEGGWQQYAEITVPPGGTHHWSTPLSEIFRSFAPGKYELTVEVKYSAVNEIGLVRKRSLTVAALPFTVAR